MERSAQVHSDVCKGHMFLQTVEHLVPVKQSLLSVPAVLRLVLKAVAVNTEDGQATVMTLRQIVQPIQADEAVP